MNANTDESRRPGRAEDDSIRDGSEPRVGFGKRVGLYGCGFVLLGLLIAAVVLFLTGVYVPFEGTEGVGP